jgi:hypothetical protein
MFFFPWYPAMMLAAEANNVIDIRLRLIARGGDEAAQETRLMVDEKVNAVIDAVSLVMRGKSADVIDFYRTQVAANAMRLTQGRS